MNKSEVFLSLGSNMGDRLKNLKIAVRCLNNIYDTRIFRVSRIYETEPVEVLDKQCNYLNCCVKILTKLAPELLLNECQKIENTMGRKRPFFHAARIIDIDILLYDDLKLYENSLVIPHKRMMDRAFVLKPLLDIYDKNNKKGNYIMYQKRLNYLGYDGIKLYSYGLEGEA